MEKIVKRVMIPKFIEVQSDEFEDIITYKTTDGVEFKSYFDALEHEDRLAYTATEEVEFELQTVGDYWYKVKTEDERNAFVRHLSKGGTIRNAENIVLGEWFSTHWDSDGDYCYIVSLREFKKDVDELYEFLEKEG